MPTKSMTNSCSFSGHNFSSGNRTAMLSMTMPQNVCNNQIVYENSNSSPAGASMGLQMRTTNQIDFVNNNLSLNSSNAVLTSSSEGITMSAKITTATTTTTTTSSITHSYSHEGRGKDSTNGGLANTSKSSIPSVLVPKSGTLSVMLQQHNITSSVIIPDGATNKHYHRNYPVSNINNWSYNSNNSNLSKMFISKGVNNSGGEFFSAANSNSYHYHRHHHHHLDKIHQLTPQQQQQPQQQIQSYHNLVNGHSHQQYYQQSPMQYQQQQQQYSTKHSAILTSCTTSGKQQQHQQQQQLPLQYSEQRNMHYNLQSGAVSGSYHHHHQPPNYHQQSNPYNNSQINESTFQQQFQRMQHLHQQHQNRHIYAGAGVTLANNYTTPHYHFRHNHNLRQMQEFGGIHSSGSFSSTANIVNSSKSNNITTIAVAPLTGSITTTSAVATVFPTGLDSYQLHNLTNLSIPEKSSNVNEVTDYSVQSKGGQLINPAKCYRQNTPTIGIVGENGISAIVNGVRNVSLGTGPVIGTEKSMILAESTAGIQEPLPANFSCSSSSSLSSSSSCSASSSSSSLASSASSLTAIGHNVSATRGATCAITAPFPTVAGTAPSIQQQQHQRIVAPVFHQNNSVGVHNNYGLPQATPLTQQPSLSSILPTQRHLLQSAIPAAIPPLPLTAHHHHHHHHHRQYLHPYF